MSNSETISTTAVRDAVSDFPSAEGVAKLRDIKNRLVSLTEKRAAAARRLHLARENSGAIEALGNDPTRAINDAATELRKTESEIPDAKNELARTFLAETAKYESIHGNLWASVYNDQVLPLAKRFAAIADDFDKSIGELQKLLQADDGALADLAAFDARIGDWNRVVRELSGPLNSEINSGLTAQKSVADSLDRGHGLIHRFEKTLKNLREALYPAVAPKVQNEDESVRLREDAEILRRETLLATAHSHDVEERNAIERRRKI
ncbi:MAG TPA: hypothetical protein VNK23_12120 [Candidatus Dormibacteraeota bacterium]|nr:hypothetical protein [Candidatus Dormibacteraeota bacterium]